MTYHVVACGVPTTNQFLLASLDFSKVKLTLKTKTESGVVCASQY